MHENCFKNSDNYKPSKIKGFGAFQNVNYSWNFCLANSWNRNDELNEQFKQFQHYN